MSQAVVPRGPGCGKQVLALLVRAILLCMMMEGQIHMNLFKKSLFPIPRKEFSPV